MDQTELDDFRLTLTNNGYDDSDFTINEKDELIGIRIQSCL